MKERIKNLFRWSWWKPRLKKALTFLLNPKLLLCFGIAWFFTNGWSYVAVLVGTWLNLPWLIGIGSAYLAFLWFPFTPEKILTVIIAIWLLKLLFPNDKNTLAVLMQMRESFRSSRKKKKEQEGKTEPENAAGQESNTEQTTEKAEE